MSTQSHNFCLCRHGANSSLPVPAVTGEPGPEPQPVGWPGSPFPGWP